MVNNELNKKLKKDNKKILVANILLRSFILTVGFIVISIIIVFIHCSNTFATKYGDIGQSMIGIMLLFVLLATIYGSYLKKNVANYNCNTFAFEQNYQKFSTKKVKSSYIDKIDKAIKKVCNNQILNDLLLFFNLFLDMVPAIGIFFGDNELPSYIKHIGYDHDRDILSNINNYSLFLIIFSVISFLISIKVLYDNCKSYKEEKNILKNYKKGSHETENDKIPRNNFIKFKENSIKVKRNNCIMQSISLIGTVISISLLIGREFAKHSGIVVNNIPLNLVLFIPRACISFMIANILIIGLLIKNYSIEQNSCTLVSNASTKKKNSTTNVKR